MVFGEKNEVLSERRWPGGKGVNVARWLKASGQEVRLFLPLGGGTGKEIADGLKAEGISTTTVGVNVPTRVNVIVTPDQGSQLRFNPVWQELRPSEWRQVGRQVEKSLRAADLLVLSGSLPAGAPVTAYATLLRQARRLRLRAILDCDGPAFAKAIPARPFLVKPNLAELEQWVGNRLPNRQTILSAARQLSQATHGWVLVSLGARGALVIDAATGTWWSTAVSVSRVLNTVGAGDALLAGVVRAIAESHPPDEWLCCGVAAGAAAVSFPGGSTPPPEALARAYAEARNRLRSGRLPHEKGTSLARRRKALHINRVGDTIESRRGHYA